MKSYGDMTLEEQDAYKKKYGFFYSATVIWINKQGKHITSNYDCTSIKELNDIIKSKKPVYLNRFIRHVVQYKTA